MNDEDCADGSLPNEETNLDSEDAANLSKHEEESNSLEHGNTSDDEFAEASRDEVSIEIPAHITEQQLVAHNAVGIRENRSTTNSNELLNSSTQEAGAMMENQSGSDENQETFERTANEYLIPAPPYESAPPSPTARIAPITYDDNVDDCEPPPSYHEYMRWFNRTSPVEHRVMVQTITPPQKTDWYTIITVTLIVSLLFTLIYLFYSAMVLTLDDRSFL